MPAGLLSRRGIYHFAPAACPALVRELMATSSIPRNAMTRQRPHQGRELRDGRSRWGRDPDLRKHWSGGCRFSVSYAANCSISAIMSQCGSQRIPRTVSGQSQRPNAFMDRAIGLKDSKDDITKRIDDRRSTSTSMHLLSRTGPSLSRRSRRGRETCSRRRPLIKRGICPACIGRRPSVRTSGSPFRSSKPRRKSRRRGWMAPPQDRRPRFRIDLKKGVSATA